MDISKTQVFNIPTTVQYLLVEKVEVEKTEQTKSKADYIFEPGMEGLLEELIQPSCKPPSTNSYWIRTLQNTDTYDSHGQGI